MKIKKKKKPSTKQKSEISPNASEKSLAFRGMKIMVLSGVYHLEDMLEKIDKSFHWEAPVDVEKRTKRAIDELKKIVKDLHAYTPEKNESDFMATWVRQKTVQTRERSSFGNVASKRS